MKRTRREYEKVALVAARESRTLGLNWARRGRKSTTLGWLGFDELSKGPGRMVIGASASLLLGREMTSMTLNATHAATAREAEDPAHQEANAVRAVFTEGATDRGLQFQVADASTDRLLQGLTPEDFGELYKSSKLELRLYYDRTSYSRQQIVAPNPATMRGWRGLVLFDEFGYVASALARELIDAADPMMRDVADLKMIFACNMPLDDRHPWFEMTLPRELTAGNEEAQFPADPAGHLYRSQTDLLIHRVALQDMYAAGHRLYDNAGAEMTYEQCLRFPAFRSSLDISYRLLHRAGGASVVDLFALTTAQRRGLDRRCGFFFIEDDREFGQALAHLREHLGEGDCGAGVDVATTTGESSNPTSVTVTEAWSGEYRTHVLLWKTRDARVQRERIGAVIRAVRGRACGKPLRRLCLDSTNEQLFARETRDELGHLVPIELIDARNSVEPVPPGYVKTPNYKTWLGDLYAAEINDNRFALPADSYLKEDHRLVTKSGGLFHCDPLPDGKHGDTFDSGKLALHALRSRSGALEAEGLAGIRLSSASAPGLSLSPRFSPRRLSSFS